MNRLSTENLVEPINKDLEFQLQDPFLLYRNGNCECFKEIIKKKKITKVISDALSACANLRDDCQFF